ncbi:MAG TPA: hypothetical protein V6D17_00695 [Candidatus Obscuribacterales bacterium]
MGGGHGSDNKHAHAEVRHDEGRENFKHDERGDGEDNFKNVRDALSDKDNKDLKAAFDKDNPQTAEFLKKHFGDVEIVGAKEDEDGSINLELKNVPKGWAHARLDKDGEVEFENGCKVHKDGEVEFKDGTRIDKDGKIHLANGDWIDKDGKLRSKDGEELLPKDATQTTADPLATTSEPLVTPNEQALVSYTERTADVAAVSAVASQGTGEVTTATATQVHCAKTAIDQLIKQCMSEREITPALATTIAALKLAADRLETASRNMQTHLEIAEKGANHGLNNDRIARLEKSLPGHTMGYIEMQMENDFVAA